MQWYCRCKFSLLLDGKDQSRDRIKRVDVLNVITAQFEIKNIGIFFDSFW